MASMAPGRSCSPWPTPTRRSTPCWPAAMPRSWRRAAATSPTRSTTCWPSPACSVACSTPRATPSPSQALLAAATALADVVADDERQANYIVPSVFHPDLAIDRRGGRAAGRRGRRHPVPDRPAPGSPGRGPVPDPGAGAAPSARPTSSRPWSWFPVVGALIGAVVGGVAAGLGELVPMAVAAAVAVLVGVLVTGAFHEDGLADTADAVAGGWTARAPVGDPQGPPPRQLRRRRAVRVDRAAGRRRRRARRRPPPSPGSWRPTPSAGVPPS